MAIDYNDPWQLANAIANLFTKYPQVRATALGGSQATTKADRKSDLDIYIFNDAPIPIEDRLAIAREWSNYYEVGNQTFGEGDEWIEKTTGRAVDLIYFGADWMQEQLDRPLVRHQPSVGYSTAFWHTIRVARPIYDPTGWFAELQRRANEPYPDELRRAIINYNHPLLRNCQSSLLYQLTRALDRDDLVAVNHRLATMLASYFDIIFALNRLPHPGEKRQVEFVRDKCAIVPANFEQQLRAVLQKSNGAPDLPGAINTFLDSLDDLLHAEHVFPTPVGTSQGI